jgi:hypothetical protein
MKMHPSNRSKINIKGGAIALALATFTLTACQTPDDTAGTTPGQDPAATEQTTPGQDQQAVDRDQEAIQIGDLAGNLEDYLGQTVSVRGEVTELMGSEAFVIQGDGLFGGDEVVVFNTTGEPLPQIGDEITQQVQVTGQVQQVVIDDIAQQHGLVLDEATFGEYENNPAIIAENIALAPDPGELSDNPEAFYDQMIAVEGDVGEQYDANVFTLARGQFLGGSDLLVINEADGTMANLEDFDEVIIMGTLRPFNLAELENEYNLTWDQDLRQSIEDDYSDEPVIIAQSIYPIDR